MDAAPDLTAHAINCVDQIRSETHAAFAKIVVGDDAEKQAVLEGLRARLESYLARLGKIATTTKGGLKKKLALAKLEWAGKDAALFAVLRGLGPKQSKIDAAKAFKQAETLSVFVPVAESVFVHWRPKDKGGFRLIVNPGPLRRAQQLMVRDALSMLGIDSGFDFSKRGEGEKPLLQSICAYNELGYEWWWTPDIKDCFGSIRPSHLSWLPIDGRVLKNVMFFPAKCAGLVKMKVTSDEAQTILLSLGIDPASLPSVDAIVELWRRTEQRVCRGLSQGFPLSPLLTRAVVGRELRAAIGEADVCVSSYCDDLFLGSGHEKTLEGVKGAVTKHFLSLSGGPIVLLDSPITETRVADFLGYSVQPGKGYGDSSAHVRPGFKRTKRFRGRLASVLDRCETLEDLSEKPSSYWRGWYGSQAAWTKVPFHSEKVSRRIGSENIENYLNDLPMGASQTKKAKAS